VVDNDGSKSSIVITDKFVKSWGVLPLREPKEHPVVKSWGIGTPAHPQDRRLIAYADLVLYIHKQMSRIYFLSMIISLPSTSLLYNTYFLHALYFATLATSRK